MSDKIENFWLNKWTWLCLVLLLSGSFFVSGIYGFKVILILLFFALPFFLILDLFDFSFDEKIIFSLFISLAFFSLLIYWINQIIPSYRYSLIVAYVVLIVSYLGLRFSKKWWSKSASH